MRLARKAAFVTGAASGLGRAIAAAFVAEEHASRSPTSTRPAAVRPPRRWGRPRSSSVTTSPTRRPGSGASPRQPQPSAASTRWSTMPASRSSRTSRRPASKIGAASRPSTSKASSSAASTPSPSAGGRRRRDHQHVFRCRNHRRPEPSCLLREQRRGEAAHEIGRAPLRAPEGRHPLQLDPSGLHRDADGGRDAFLRTGSRAEAGRARIRGAARTARRPGGRRRGRGLSRLGRGPLRHRDRGSSSMAASPPPDFRRVAPRRLRRHGPGPSRGAECRAFRARTHFVPKTGTLSPQFGYI